VAITVAISDPTTVTTFETEIKILRVIFFFLVKTVVDSKILFFNHKFIPKQWLLFNATSFVINITSCIATQTFISCINAVTS